jgi:hypothetical protein
MDTELFKDVTDVHFYRRVRDEQRSRNLGIRASLQNEFIDVAFSRGQGVVSALLARHLQPAPAAECDVA